MSKNSHFFRLDKKFVGLFVLIIAAFGAFILFRSQAAVQNPPAPAVYLTPTSITYPANQTFTVNLRANSGSTTVNAVGATITYPANLLDFQSISTTGTAYPTVAASTGGSGTVRIEAGIAAGSNALTGDNFVATITFKTKTASGVANLAFTSATQLINSSTFVDILGSTSNTYGADFTIDTTAPVTSITAPANNAVIAGGSTATITASATDNSSVASVDILIDGSVKTTLASGPYNYSWNTTSVSLGAHTIQAIARDPYGNIGPSQIVNVTVADKTAPTVSLTAPANNATVIGTIPLTATAADNTGGTGVAKVEFYVQDALVGTDTTSPYSINWNSTALVDGNYTVYAKAYDKAVPANTTPTQPITINIDNTDDEPPTAPGNFRSTGATLDTISLAWNASTDNEGVTGYRISRNGTVIATVNALTYTDTSLSDGTSYNYTISALDAAGNNSQTRSVSASTNQLKIGDFNRDENVTIVDLAILLSKWDQADPAVDLDNSGKVGLVDLSIFLSNYPK